MEITRYVMRLSVWAKSGRAREETAEEADRLLDGINSAHECS